jgi:hypothetical protein
MIKKTTAETIRNFLRSYLCRNQDHLGVHMQELADSLHVRPITLKPYLCDLLIAKAITNEIDVNYFKPV